MCKAKRDDYESTRVRKAMAKTRKRQRAIRDQQIKAKGGQPATQGKPAQDRNGKVLLSPEALKRYEKLEDEWFMYGGDEQD